MVKLMIGADIVPTGSNQNIFESGRMEEIVDKKILDLLKGADYCIFNLEVPLTDTKRPIPKCGPNLIASAKSVVGLRQLGIDFLTLANNHILDQGEQGLWSTAKQLDRAGIAYAGIGRTSAEAAKPHIVELDGKKIGIYCCAEHEFSIVGDRQAGANPFDPLESPDHVSILKKQCDYVIVLYHGGKEHYRYPSPGLQKICRKIVEKGADFVVCQHTHCIGCEEQWQDGTIVYGQGNFLFDHSESEFWQTSLLIELNIGDKPEIIYHPIRKNGNGVVNADYEKMSIIKKFNERSAEIGEPGFIEKKYKEFCAGFTTQVSALAGINVKGIIYRGLNKISGHRFGKWYIGRKLTGKKKLMLRNLIECEAWRELILKQLEQ